jgi:hypothetical protein
LGYWKSSCSLYHNVNGKSTGYSNLISGPPRCIIMKNCMIVLHIESCYVYIFELLKTTFVFLLNCVYIHHGHHCNHCLWIKKLVCLLLLYAKLVFLQYSQVFEKFFGEQQWHLWALVDIYKNSGLQKNSVIITVICNIIIIMF